jgi:hypothetical protein
MALLTETRSTPTPNRVERLAILVFALTWKAFAQQEPAATSDPFQQHVAGVGLNDQSIVDGIAMLSRGTRLPVSVEFPLGVTISGPAPPLKTLTANVGPGTVTEVLDGLCALDPTFTWMRNGNMVNVLPSALAKDPNYVLNRKIGEVTFQDVQQASDAVMKMVGQLPGPREQIAVLQVGLPLNFSEPWSTTLKDVTLREVVNKIAQRLGPSYGWQFSGAKDFRMITFHEGLLPKSSRIKSKQP